MEQLFLVAAGIGLGAIGLVIGRIMSEYGNIVTTRVFSLLLLGAASYMLQPFVETLPVLNVSFKVFSAATPAIFWMCASTLFNTHETNYKIHKGHYAGLLLCLGLGINSCVFTIDSSPFSLPHTVMLLCTIVLVILGMVDIFRNWQSDLVDCRRKLRIGLAFTSGGFLLFVVASEFVFGHGAFPDYLNYINVTFISGYALFLGYVILISRFNVVAESIEELSETLVIKDIPSPSVADKEWLDKLTHAMDSELYYRQNELTIRLLSDHLHIPEHQLRRLINQHLGYRNFNDYLNRYRIKDAAQKLSDPKLIRTPILTIAIESGYASLTTFNKAFKTLKEMTPTEFRRMHTIDAD
ncbi:helix-turn-helix domain-containing protein [Paraglaciecola sp.]|uniref:AraC family transcriptional regulator n=1 Tax=Paraglaciecola sp. TaxID=1920173 RepID=UPI003EFA4CE0